ncbi:hypothetical protein OUZ56_001752 [Daphnia magna]|uniref:Uncharacterized protein n=1 Tax=Daphnia magna TaxID=35525 RepID=A0ABR0A3L3_9CRUS|nr:hypothetical protein OUZ56_001752 [Daphnia magna]
MLVLFEAEREESELAVRTYEKDERGSLEGDRPLPNQTGTRTTSLLPLIERTAASAAIYVSSSSGLIVLEPWLQAIYRLWAS